MTAHRRKTEAPGVRLRRLTARDWPRVRPFVRQFYAHFGYRFSDATQGRAFRRMLRIGRLGCAWMIEAAGAPAGYLVLALGWSIEYGGRVAVVDEVFVTKALRGRGLGRLALCRVRAAARRLGVRRLFLEVESYNAGAKRLYKDLGFADTRRTLMTADLIRAGRVAKPS